MIHVADPTGPGSESPFEQWLCACVMAPCQFMAAASAMTALQWELYRTVAAASFAPLDGVEALAGPAALVDTLTNRMLFDLDFLLGMRGEEQAFPE